MLAEAGYDPHAAYNVWYKILMEEEAAAVKGRKPGMFSQTHPNSADRASYLKDFVETYFGPPAANTETDPELLRVLNNNYYLLMEDQIDTNRFGRTEEILRRHGAMGVAPGVLHFFHGEMYRQRGAPGDIVDVKPGYGRNYLVPRGMAIVWTQGAEKQIAQIKRAQEVRHVRDVAHAEELRGILEGLSVSLTAKAGESGTLFGRITEKEIAQAIKKAGGPDVDRRRIVVDETVKTVGAHQAKVALHPDVDATVAFEVVAA